MLSVKNILIILALVASISCKSLQWAPIENANRYQLERTKDEVIKKDLEVVLGRMKWNKRDASCTAQYTFDEKEYCLQYLGRPDYRIEIAENGNTIATITSIKKHVSTLEWSGEDYILRPIKGKIVALYKGEAIARIYNSKKKWFLEITPEHENNQLLVAALFYKEAEWNKQNNLDGDVLLLFLLLSASI